MIRPPDWKPFSIAIPMPSTVAPADWTIWISPCRAQAVGQEIIDDQDVIIGIKKFLRHDHVIDTLVSERFNFRHVHLAVQVDALGLLGEYDRHIKMLGRHAGDADARRLDGEDLVDRPAGEPAFKLAPIWSRSLISI